MIIEDIILSDFNVTNKLGYLLGQNLPPLTTILLKGNLGVGKTSLVQGIGQGLNITEPIVSPTFTLISEYLEGRLPLYHLDLYRLSPEQTATIYPELYWEGVEFEPGITAIEWSERLLYQPSDRLEIELRYHKKEGRLATLKVVGDNYLDLSFLKDLYL